MAEDISVVIPTYNRAATLQQTLRALLRPLERAARLEILVIDDGSSDNTAAVVTGMRVPDGMTLRYLHQDRAGAGRARNRGIKEASGHLLLFIDDDIVASPALVAGHLRSHEAGQGDRIAVLGRVELAPWIARTGINLRHAVHRWQGLQHGAELDWQHFFTGNISLRRSFLLENELLFDPALPRYQDTEFGYRCAAAGLRIIYNERALGYHNHDIQLDSSLPMMRRYGEALAVLHHRYPELKSQLGDYLVFSWHQSPQRIARDLLRPLLLNGLTANTLELAARLLQRNNRPLPDPLARRLANYYERQGYSQEMQRLLRPSPARAGNLSRINPGLHAGPDEG